MNSVMGAFLRKYSFCSSWQLEAEFTDRGAGQRKTSFCWSWQKEDEFTDGETGQGKISFCPSWQKEDKLSDGEFGQIFILSSWQKELDQERLRSAQADNRKMNWLMEERGKERLHSAEADRRKTNSLMEELDKERKTSFCSSWQQEDEFTDGETGQRKASFCSSCKVHRKNEDREIMPARRLKPPLTLKQFAFSPAPLAWGPADGSCCEWKWKPTEWQCNTCCYLSMISIHRAQMESPSSLTPAAAVVADASTLVFNITTCFYLFTTRSAFLVR